MQSDISVGLEAVIVAVTDDVPRVLTVPGTDAVRHLPSGPLDPVIDQTLDLALRRWVLDQAGLSLGYVEQLYTFGDRDRDPRGRVDGVRMLSIAYLALVREEQPSKRAAWLDWYDLLPWEDHRDGPPPMLQGEIAPALVSWGAATRDATESALRQERIQIAFGLSGAPWDPVRVLERYELMYEVGLIAEAHRDGSGEPGLRPIDSLAMGLDHRRIVATAFARIRGKLSYRPVVFEMLSETFTLRQLQSLVESLSGSQLHTQNFRRMVEQGGLVEGTGQQEQTGGRPAELFSFRREVLIERPRPGVGTPGSR
jgi:hypothetical protein